MSVHLQTMSVLSNRARQALLQELGAVDTMRFLSQFRDGHGDYVSEREEFFKDDSVTGIIAGIKARRKIFVAPVPTRG